MPNKGASREAIQFHYDLGNRFYARLLGESMIYSAGLWDGVDGAKMTLSEAQNRKLDWHIAAAGLSSGQRLLDVGCGWGGLMARAVAAKDLSQAVGLTLSDEQAAWIEEGSKDPRITVQNRPWQEFKNQEPFDAIVSIGAIEHFARPEMDTAAKLDCYSEFFEFLFTQPGRWRQAVASVHHMDEHGASKRKLQSSLGFFPRKQPAPPA